MILETIPQPWLTALPELQSIADDIARRLTAEPDVRPVRGLWYEALRRVSPDTVSVVILGQDPYHGEDRGINQAHGLSFSVPAGVRPPPSLRNILKELRSDTGESASIENGVQPSPVNEPSGDLSRWSDQGVLLLNASLTTKGGQAGAHKKLWLPFTLALMRYLGARQDPMVFILWGADAQKYRGLIASHHAIIESAHPSPLSSHRGFFGSKPFSKTNAALLAFGKPTIHW